MGVAQGQTGIVKEVPDEADIAWALALKSASEQVMKFAINTVTNTLSHHAQWWYDKVCAHMWYN